MARLAKLKDAGTDKLREKAELQEALVRCAARLKPCCHRRSAPCHLCVQTPIRLYGAADRAQPLVAAVPACTQVRRSEEQRLEVSRALVDFQMETNEARQEWANTK